MVIPRAGAPEDLAGWAALALGTAVLAFGAPAWKGMLATRTRQRATLISWLSSRRSSRGDT
ncbi:MAG: hypothetical protein R3B70_09485 [Polyangiaceae bacterium]